jgi:hypothetical protein
VFDRAQKLRQRNRAESTRNRKYDYLLIGHIKCTCGFRSRGVSKGSPDHLLLYYACPCVVYEHKCGEKAVRADLADKLVWDWLVGILNNDEVRNEGLRLQAEERATLMEPKRKRLVVVHDLVDQAEKKIKRLASAIANVDDETAVSALQAELRIASKEKVSLTEELDRLTIELEQDELSERSIEAINARVEQVRRELENPTFETKRGLLDDLDVQTRLVREGDKRFLGVSCVLTPEHLRIPRDGDGRLGSDDLGQHSPTRNYGCSIYGP